MQKIHHCLMHHTFETILVLIGVSNDHSDHRPPGGFTPLEVSSSLNTGNLYSAKLSQEDQNLQTAALPLKHLLDRHVIEEVSGECHECLTPQDE